MCVCVCIYAVVVVVVVVVKKKCAEMRSACVGFFLPLRMKKDFIFLWRPLKKKKTKKTKKREICVLIEISSVLILSLLAFFSTLSKERRKEGRRNRTRALTKRRKEAHTFANAQ